MSFQSTTKVSTAQNEVFNQTSLVSVEEINVLVFVLPVASILLAATIIIGIFCVFKRTKRTKSKYKNSEIPRTQSTASEEYEEYGTDFQSTDSEITENLYYDSNCTRI